MKIKNIVKALATKETAMFVGGAVLVAAGVVALVKMNKAEEAVEEVEETVEEPETEEVEIEEVEVEVEVSKTVVKAAAVAGIVVGAAVVGIALHKNGVNFGYHKGYMTGVDTSYADFAKNNKKYADFYRQLQNNFDAANAGNVVIKHMECEGEDEYFALMTKKLYDDITETIKDYANVVGAENYKDLGEVTKKAAEFVKTHCTAEELAALATRV